MITDESIQHHHLDQPNQTNKQKKNPIKSESEFLYLVGNTGREEHIKHYHQVQLAKFKL